MIKKRTREELYDKFRQGAIPSGADFADYIESQLNLLDDGIDVPEDPKEPICFRAHGEKESILDFSDSNGTKRWRVSGRCEDESNEGLNIQADQQSKFYIERETGNIGISTDKPEAKLHIIQTDSADALKIDDIANDETPLVVSSDGQVGLGTASPTAQLHISYSGSGDILRVDDTEDDTSPFTINDEGNTGIGCEDPKAKLTVVEGGVSIGKNDDPGDSNLYVAGNLEVGGSVVFSSGSGVSGFEINAPLTSKTNELTIKDNLRIIGDNNQVGSDGNLTVAGHTTLGTYNATYENQKVVTLNGRIRSGDNGSGEQQYQLEVNEVLTIDRTPKKEKVSVGGNLVIEGNLTGNGNAQLGGTLSAKDTNVTGVLSTSGNAVVGGTLTAKGAIINGTFNSSGNAQVGGTLTAKSASIEGSLSSTGDSTIGGTITAQGIQCNGIIDADEVVVNGVVAATVNMVPPVGSIISWLPGLYQNADQTGFNFKSVALPENWRLCNGSAVTDSPLLGTGYLPRLTDDRFLMGVTDIGDLGSQAGNNDGLTHTHNFTNPLVPGHKHGVGSLGTTQNGSHTHTWLHGIERDDKGHGGSYDEFTLIGGNSYGVLSVEGAHTHSITGVAGNTAGLNGDNSLQTINGSVNVVNENLTDANLPKYLAVYYIMRVK